MGLIVRALCCCYWHYCFALFPGHHTFALWGRCSQSAPEIWQPDISFYPKGEYFVQMDHNSALD